MGINVTIPFGGKVRMVQALLDAMKYGCTSRQQSMTFILPSSKSSSPICPMGTNLVIPPHLWYLQNEGMTTA